MQKRSVKDRLSKSEAAFLLSTEAVGNLGTLDESGFPYITPVHFIYHDGKIYIHSARQGKKIQNIHRDKRVCFEIYRMNKLVHNESCPCHTNTAYESVVLSGEATFENRKGKKNELLSKFVEKYAAQHEGAEFSEEMLGATAIIEITPCEISGKFYR